MMARTDSTESSQLAPTIDSIGSVLPTEVAFSFFVGGNSSEWSLLSDFLLIGRTRFQMSKSMSRTIHRRLRTQRFVAKDTYSGSLPNLPFRSSICSKFLQTFGTMLLPQNNRVSTSKTFPPLSSESSDDGVVVQTKTARNLPSIVSFPVRSKNQVLISGFPRRHKNILPHWRRACQVFDQKGEAMENLVNMHGEVST